MTTIDPRTSPLDAIRDWLAEQKGWRIEQDGILVHPNEEDGRAQRAGVLPRHDHPFPPTIDGAASAMPEGWSIKIVTHKGNCQATAWPSRLDRLPSVHSPYNPMVRFHEAPTEMEARFRLAAACILAQEKTNGS